MKNITILGSTGSIGTQALEVISKLETKFEIFALSAGQNIELLKKQIHKFAPKVVCVQNEKDALELSKMYPKIDFVFGEQGLIEISTNKINDILLVAVSGKTGLKPTLAAIEQGINIALANKETLVMAGEIVIQKAKEKNVKILPVDSEHSAIAQCLQDIENTKFIKNLIITASGGPFRLWNFEKIKEATVKETLAHPKWSMGAKITVDSATLMNKGLEVIEAHHLFNIDYVNIKVVVHPESIIHSAIEYNDGSILAQLGLPSMHIPIQYAITYPERVEGIKTDSFDFVKISQLNFEAPNYEKFPCLKLAFEAGRQGGLYPIALNAANEEAVFAFLKGNIKLFDIYKITDKIITKVNNINQLTLDEIIEYDKYYRNETKKLISNY